MILSGKEIEKRIGKDIFIEPFDKSRINPNSYNLTLSNELLVYEAVSYTHLDVYKRQVQSISVSTV